MTTPYFGQHYRHYKGGIYRFLHLGLHTETEETVVVYEHFWPHKPSIYVRPADMFFGELDNGNKRFIPLTIDEVRSIINNS